MNNIQTTAEKTSRKRISAAARARMIARQNERTGVKEQLQMPVGQVAKMVAEAFHAGRLTQSR